MIQHVLVDFDRTLNDSDAVYEKNMNGFLGLSGHEVLQQWEAIHREVLAKEPKERHEDVEHHYKLMIGRWRLGEPEEVKKELRSRVKAAQAECWYATALFNEAIPFLSAIKDAGYNLHIATGDYAELKANAIHQKAGRTYFEWAFDETVLGVGKGQAGYFERLLRKLKVPADQALMVGDSLVNDIGPAKEAGIATIWIRRKNEKLRDSIEPDITVASLMEARSRIPYR